MLDAWFCHSAWYAWRFPMSMGAKDALDITGEARSMPIRTRSSSVVPSVNLTSSRRMTVVSAGVTGVQECRMFDPGGPPESRFQD